MKYILSVLVLIMGFQAWSENNGGKGGSDIGSSSLDTYFRAGDEVKAMEMKLLGLPKSENGPLVKLYACVSSQVATGAVRMQLERQFKEETLAAFKSIPVGSKLIDKILEEDPKALDLNLESLPYTESCKEHIVAAHAEKRISVETFAKVLRLSELSGQVLGQYMTSSK